MPRGDALTIASDLIQGTLLLVATAAFLPNTARSRCPTRHIRFFWILTSLGMLFWLIYQGMWNYFEVIKRQDVPDPFLGDIVLFLHLVPMIAALAVFTVSGKANGMNASPHARLYPAAHLVGFRLCIRRNCLANRTGR